MLSDRCEPVSDCGFAFFPLMMNDIEHVFMLLLVICISFLEKCIHVLRLLLKSNVYWVVNFFKYKFRIVSPY